MMHSIQKNHLSFICSEGGALPRTTILKNHLNFREHIESVKVDKLKHSSVFELVHNAPLNKIISSQDQKLSQKIWRNYMYSI